MKSMKYDFKVSIRRFRILDEIVLEASTNKAGVEYHYAQCYEDSTPIGLIVDQFYKQADEVFDKLC